MIDYAFFAMLFAIATALAPAGAAEVQLQNVRHPEQSLDWRRGPDGRWAMTMNGREVGHFERQGDAVVHYTGIREPDRFALGELVDASDLRRDATRLRLGARFGGRALTVERAEGRVELVDPVRSILVTRLRLGPDGRPRR